MRRLQVQPWPTSHQVCDDLDHSLLFKEVCDVLETFNITDCKLCFSSLVLKLTFEDLFDQLVPVACRENSPEVTFSEDGFLLVYVERDYP